MTNNRKPIMFKHGDKVRILYGDGDRYQLMGSGIHTVEHVYDYKGTGEMVVKLDGGQHVRAEKVKLVERAEDMKEKEIKFPINTKVNTPDNRNAIVVGVHDTARWIMYENTQMYNTVSVDHLKERNEFTKYYCDICNLSFFVMKGTDVAYCPKCRQTFIVGVDIVQMEVKYGQRSNSQKD